MKRYNELGTAHRNEPCVEYPGTWHAYQDGTELGQYNTFGEALAAAKLANDETGNKTSVGWSASDNDPRIGQVWMTGFYIHGRFDQFGFYRDH